MKIGLYGGSFDPVHNEHVRFAQAAKEALGLDKVIILPAGAAPHKKSGRLLRVKTALRCAASPLRPFRGRRSAILR